RRRAGGIGVEGRQESLRAHVQAGPMDGVAYPGYCMNNAWSDAVFRAAARRGNMNEWYFAYGSNLWIDQMAARTGPIGQGDDRPRVALLPDHRLVFNMQGNDGQVYANLERPGEGVIGVIYCCSAAALDKLDAYESGYERRPVQVTDEGGISLEAVAYV